MNKFERGNFTVAILNVIVRFHTELPTEHE